MMVARALQAQESDESLAQAARQGAGGAFVELVARHQARIYRLAMRMSRNHSDAEEITQETFLRALRAISSFRGQARVGTWIYRIAVTEALMRRRAARRRPTQSLELVAPSAEELDAAVALGGATSEAADDVVHRRLLAERVRHALAQLDEGHRAAFVLRDLEELSAEEAGAILGVSAATVRQRAHRARLKLRAGLGSLVGVEVASRRTTTGEAA